MLQCFVTSFHDLLTVAHLLYESNYIRFNSLWNKGGHVIHVTTQRSIVIGHLHATEVHRCLHL